MSGMAAVKQTLLTVRISTAYEYPPVIKDSDHRGSFFMTARLQVKTYHVYLIYQQP